MDASHREAKLVASSHQVPLNPNTGARVAQYEREDILGALATAAVTEALKEAQREVQEKTEKTLASADFNSNFSGMDERTHLSLEDKVNFSDIYHSNAAYFKKLEELKAAHMETMAKLEKMYQNQLNLKAVQPVIIRENAPSVSSRSDSEKSYPPVSLMSSFSEPDLGRSSSIYPSSSEDELHSLEREHPRKSRAMTYAKELINNMWKNFSVEDYIQSDGADIPSVEKIRKKPKEWVPKITVPEPFQMMIREQKKRDENMKSKSDIEMIHRLLKKQEEDDAECQKKFRANPVPAYVFLPRYHDIVKQNEERRRAGKAKSKEALLASQKPFKFIAREEQKQAAREKQRDFFKPKKKPNRFKARPIPRSIYGSTANDRLKEEEVLIRNFKTPLRIPDHSQNPSLLPSRPAHRNPEKRNWKHKVKCQSPDAENLPEKCQKYLLGSKNNCSKLSPGCKPFHLRAPLHSSSTKEKVLADIKADEENSKETCWPYLSARHKSPLRSASSKPVPCGCTPPRPTVSSRERGQAIRRSLEEKKMLEEERNRILTKQKQRMKELQKLLVTRAKAYDSHESLAQMSKSRIKSLRRSKKERMREYRQELEEREEKLKKRPLLFERVAQKNARMAAEKHYSNTLKALGICDEFVSKKGQAGKILEYFSNQEMTSFTEDKESFNEEKIEEREKRDENYLVDINSQESCKEKDEISEESGEENSVEE